MSNSKAASRYAKSLIDLSTEQGAMEAVRADMASIVSVITANPMLGAILNNPIIPLDKKAGILKDTFSGRVSAVTDLFLKLIVSKGRSAIVFETAKAYLSQYNALKGIITAEVTSAIPLTEANRAEIVTIVKREVGANEVLIKEKVDEKLIGGFILKVGDRQFDASIASNLNKLKKEFSHGVV
jgi:F-type H+-transporting ATPase subunit delta